MIRGGPGEQLRMFMTAREITEEYEPLLGDRRTKYHYAPDEQGIRRAVGATWESDEQFWERKNREIQRPNKKRTKQRESIRAEGVQKPVHLTEAQQTGNLSWAHWAYPPDEMQSPKQVAGGHHRIALELHEHPDDRYLPVVHHLNFWDARLGADPRKRRQFEDVVRRPIPVRTDFPYA